MPPLPPNPPPGKNTAGAQKASLKPFMIIVAIAILIMLSRGSHSQFKPGYSLPSAPLMTLDTAEIIKLEDVVSGTSPVALHFFATWCGSCMREWDELDIISQRHGKDFRVVLIGIDSPAKLKALTTQKPTKLPVLVGGSEIESAARIRAFPYTVFVRPDLKVIFDYPGALTASAFAQARASLLGNFNSETAKDDR